METAIHKNKWFQLGSVAVVAFAGGSIGGYILGKRQVPTEVVTETTVTQLSLLDSQNRVTSTYSEDDPEVQELLEEGNNVSEVQSIGSENSLTPLRLVAGLPGSTAEQEEDSEPTVVNVFSREDDDWDWDAELSSRHSRVPYILHQDEFINDEMGFRQETLTYYAGDDIMADATDTPIYDYVGLMGELKFGHGTRDKNVVYIRNEQIHMEWEILLHQGSFSIEVLGLEQEKEVEEELKHSHRSVQKFRRSD